MPRLFIGLELPGTQARALAAVAESGPGLRWQTPGQLHLTLRFLGELSAASSAAVQRQLAALRWQAFTLQVSGVGYFGSPTRPSILWAGLADTAALQALRLRLDALLAAELAPDPQHFVPHITLARCGSGAGSPAEFLACHRQLQLPVWAVTELCLFTSEAGDNGSRYQVLARYPCTLPLGDAHCGAADQAPETGR
ncbi:MAG: RNA 2',3'-cyclic phosphodiesterase [Halopseudomonas sp.]|uniref:RNA 2',3'-cyclic phosphodiesterase n=1 Tax=Halopseudomonas sp. TaxID=2901191 RepID=UPI003003925E